MYDEVREVRFRRPDGRELGLETLRIEELLCKPGFRPSDPQRVRFHQLVLLESGTSSHEVDFVRYTTGPGTLLAIRSGQIRSFAPALTLRGQMVIFTERCLEALPDPQGRLARALRMLLWEGPTLALGSASFQEASRGLSLLEHLSSAPSHPFLPDALAATFAGWIFTLCGLPEVLERHTLESQDPLVVSFFELLEAQFRAQRTAGFYARELHVSQRTLDRHVLASTGRTAKRAIIERTVLEARRLLSQRELQVKAVAAELGFKAPQNFTRFLRRQTGEPPEAFRDGLILKLRGAP